MRKDIKEYLKQYTREEQELLNKSEIARRFNCDPRTVDRYLKIEEGIIEPRKKREYSSKLDEYKSTIINKVDVHGASAMATYKFIQKKGYTGKYSIVADFEMGGFVMKCEYELYEPSWCPGCGNYMIRTALKTALEELKIEPHEAVIVSGIGQAAKMPHYIKINGFNGLHGRAIPPAIGIKLANKNLKVIVESGDGDTYGEGGNHFIHGIRRNIDIAHFVHNNQIYGLTKGQASPTTAIGQKTTLQFDGVKVEPVQPLALALTMGAGFVARGFSGDIPHLVSLMKEAINYKGYALIDILQPCVVWNKVNTFSWYKNRVYYLPDDYDYTNKRGAMEKALEFEDKIPIGILYKEEKEIYGDKFEFIKNGPPLADRELNPLDAEKLMDEFK